MINHYKVLTITHKDVKLNRLPHYMVTSEGEGTIDEQLHDLKKKMGWGELLYLATCNRVLFCFTQSKPLQTGTAAQLLKTLHPQLEGKALSALVDDMQQFEGKDALRHIFEVGSSIDSLVVGEREILRQLREAYEKAFRAKLAGDDIRVLMRAVVETSKSVYAQTRIGEKPVSVVSLAANRLMNSGISKDARIVVVGAGQTNALFAKFLEKYEFSNVVVFNRTFSKAKALAERVGGQARPWERLQEYNEGLDALLVCTGATRSLIDPELLKQMIGPKAGEEKWPMLIDLAVPRNIDHRISLHMQLPVVDVECLREQARKNLEFRRQEVEHAQVIIEKRLQDFPSVYRRRQIERAMQKVPNEIKTIRRHTLDNVFDKEFQTLDGQSRELVERMLQYMEKKCISISMKAAKEVQF